MVEYAEASRDYGNAAAHFRAAGDSSPIVSAALSRSVRIAVDELERRRVALHQHVEEHGCLFKEATES